MISTRYFSSILHICFIQPSSLSRSLSLCVHCRFLCARDRSGNGCEVENLTHIPLTKPFQNHNNLYFLITTLIFGGAHNDKNIFEIHSSQTESHLYRKRQVKAATATVAPLIQVTFAIFKYYFACTLIPLNACLTHFMTPLVFFWQYSFESCLPETEMPTMMLLLLWRESPLCIHILFIIIINSSKKCGLHFIVINETKNIYWFRWAKYGTLWKWIYTTSIRYFMLDRTKCEHFARGVFCGIIVNAHLSLWHLKAHHTNNLFSSSIFFSLASLFF